MEISMRYGLRIESILCVHNTREHTKIILKLDSSSQPFKQFSFSLFRMSASIKSINSMVFFFCFSFQLLMVGLSYLIILIQLKLYEKNGSDQQALTPYETIWGKQRQMAISVH